MWKLLVAGLSLVAAVALGGIQLATTGLVTFTDCSASGSAAQSLTGGEYVMTVNDEAVFLCLASSGSTCASGGTKLPPGTVMVFTVGAGGVSASCRSANASGDIQFTPKNN